MTPPGRNGHNLFRQLSSPVAIFTIRYTALSALAVLLVWSVLAEAQIFENVGDAHFRRTVLLLRCKAERLLEHLGNAYVIALADPFFDRFLPGISFVPRRLLSGGESL